MDTARHKNLLTQILKDIGTDTTLSPFLGFKGGTAAQMFYGLDRFSLDLDFDLLSEGKDAAKANYVFERIKKILSPYGLLKDAEKKMFNLFFMLSYEGGARNIKVEVNLRSFGSRYEIRSYLGLSMLVMVREDMFAHKLAAMRERIGKTNRDIYDVWFFLKNRWPINQDIIEQRMKMPFKDFLSQCIAALEKLADRTILAGMGELLGEKQKAWAKVHLRKDAIFLLKVLREGQK